MTTSLSDMLALAGAERAVLDALNRTDVAPGGGGLVDEAIRAAPLADDLEACVFGSTRLTRRALLDAADRLAGTLQAAGAARGRIVAIAMPPGTDRLTAVLATLRTGAAFLPLDVDAPAERLRFQLRDSGAVLVVADARLPPVAGALPVIMLPLDDASGPAFVAPSGRAPGDAAYVIYTSGSTGRPKAAAISHRALHNRLAWMASDLGVTAGDRILHKTAFGFDVSVWEQLLPLLTGAAAIIAREDARGDADALAALIAREAVGIAHFVPTLLDAFLAGEPEAACASLRTIVCSGEALPVGVARAAAARLGCDVRNYYGPTEATIDVTAWRFDPDDGLGFVPIGRPIWNTRVHVLGPSLDPVPPGAIGELYIGGLAVGMGYVGRPALSARAFVPDPFAAAPGARLYRTGDLARVHEAGFVEFLGRRDHQVKIRGYRIELGEIEEALRSHPDVRQAVAVARATATGSPRLAAYVAAPATTSPPALEAWLRERLPGWMVPAAVVVMERLPTTANGKLDRRALPDPFGSGPAPAGTPPRGEAERLVAAAWSDVLRREVADVDAGFFAIGGDSIGAIRLVARCRASGLVLSVKDVFDHPTIRGMAAIARRAEISVRTPPERAFEDADESSVAAASPVVTLHARDCFGDDPDAALAWLAATLVAGEPAPAGAVGPCRLLAPVRDGVDEAALRLVEALARERTLVLAAARIEPESAAGDLVVAFQPARLDLDSLPMVRALLREGPGAVLSRHLLDRGIWSGAPPLPAVGLPRPSGSRRVPDGSARRRATTPVPSAARVREAMAPWMRQHATDRITAAVARAVAIETGTSAIRLIAPESRLVAGAGGFSTEGLIGRHALLPDAVLAGEALADADRILAAVGGMRAGTLDPAATAPAEIALRVTRTLPDGAGGTAVLAALRRGEVVVAIEGDRLLWSWDATLGDWPERAAARAGTLIPEHAVPRPSDAAAAALLGLAPDEAAGVRAVLGDAVGDAVDVFPLAPMQEGMLLHGIYWPRSDAYLNQNVLELVGDLDVDALERAWVATVTRHAALRTGFLVEGLGRPLGYVAARATQRIVRLDWSDGARAGTRADARDECPAARLARYLAEDRARAFDLREPGPMRLALARIAADRHLLVWTHHHILLDGWCLPLIWGDVFRSYAHLVAGTPPPGPAPRPFRDYVAWLARKGVDEADRAFWREALSGFGQPTPFSSRPRDLEGPVATDRIRYGEERTRALDAAASRIGVTVNAVVQTAWALLLWQRTGADDVVHGLSVSGRPPELPGSEDMVGLFINALPLRTRIDQRATLADLARRSQAFLAAASAHAHVSLAEITGQWRGRSGAADRLFDSLIAFENYPEDHLPDGPVAGLTIIDRFCDEKTEYPFGLIVLPGADMEFHFNYDLAHLAPGEVGALAHAFFALLDAIVAAPDDRVCTLPPLLAASEPTPGAPSAAAAGAEQPDPLHRIAAIAAGDPGRTALVTRGRAWSYGTLWSEALRLAEPLAAAPGTSAAVLAERSPAFVIGVLAAWCAGKSACPVNPAYPDATLRRVLAHVGDPPVVASPGQSARVPDGVLRLVAGVPEGTMASSAAAPDTTARAVPTVAALLLTSGTTGTPKVVAVTRAGLLNRLRATETLYGVGACILANAAPGFDIGLWEMLFGLVRGGPVVLASDDDLRDCRNLVALCAEHAVEVLHLVPSLAAQVAEVAAAGELSRLRTLIVGGEAVRPALVQRLRARAPGARIWQGYGPTEASISVTDHLCTAEDEAGERVPIGRPIAGCRVHVLDAALRPCPPGVVGELWIAGVPLAAGYVGDGRATAEAFRPDPFGGPGERMYRTGDLGVRRSDAALDFVGRRTRQVKVRGFRIEPAAVEARLAAHPLVAGAAVVVRTTASGETELVGFAVRRDARWQRAQAVTALRSWLAEALPAWAVPARLSVVDAFPVTPVGKTDHAALLAISDAAPPPRPGAFASPLERAVAEAWAEVSGARLPDRDADFFHHGGHSLLMIRFAELLGRRLGRPRAVPVHLAFKFTSPRALAEVLRGASDRDALGGLQVLARGDGAPLVLVHPVEGLVSAYRTLARHLPGRTVAAIADPRFGEEAGFASVRQMATLYAEWTRALVGDGAFVLGGWSFGGVVALEMAQQMARHGDSPAGVILLDSYDLARLDRTDRASDRADRAVDVLGAGADDATLAPLRREIARNAMLGRAAEDVRFAGPVLLARAEPDPDVARDLPEANGWRRALLPSLEIVPVPGSHETILAEPFVASTARAVLSFLTQRD